MEIPVGVGSQKHGHEPHLHLIMTQINIQLNLKKKHSDLNLLPETQFLFTTDVLYGLDVKYVHIPSNCRPTF